MKHLLTFLRHDVSATLALTVGSPSFDRRGTMLKHYAFMLLFLLGSLNVWGATEYELVYTLDCASASTNGTQQKYGVSNTTVMQGSGVKAFLNEAAGSTLISADATVTGSVYWAKGSGGGTIPNAVLKLGKSSGGGTISFTIGGADDITKVEVIGYGWKNTTAVSVNSLDAQITSTAQSKLYTFLYEISATKTIEIAVTSSAFCATQIKLYKTKAGDSPKPTVSLDHIAITGTPDKKTYEHGQSFDPTGLTVTAYYDNETNVDVTNDVEWSFDPATFTVVGENTSVTATATYQEKKASETYNDITVTEHVVTPGEYTINLTNTLFGTGVNTNITSAINASQKDISLVVNGTGKTKPRTDATYIRFYKSSSLKLSVPEGYNITKIVISENQSDYSAPSVSVGEFNTSTKTWTGKSNEVLWSFSDKSFIGQIKVTYEAIVPEVTVDPSSLTFTAKQNIAVEGKTFTLTGANLTSDLTLVASEGFTVSPESITAANAMAQGGAEVTVTPATPTATTTPVEGRVTISGGGLKDNVVVNLSMAVTPTYLVAIAVNDGDMGSATLNGGAGPVYAEYAEDVTLVATANTGYEFVNWTVSTEDIDLGENAEKANGAVAVIGAAGTITANFRAQACTGLAAPVLDDVTTTYQSATIAWEAVTKDVNEGNIDVSKIEGYEVYVYNDAQKTNTKTSDLVAEGTSFAVAHLDVNTTYYYSVMAVGDGTDYCDESNPLLEGSFTTKDYPAATLTLSDAEGTSPFPGDHKLKDVIQLPSTAASCSKTFVGWDANAECATAPTYAPGEEYTLNATTQTLYAVYADVTPGATTYTLTPATSMSEGTYVIAAYDGNYKALTGTVSSGKLVNETTGSAIDGEGKLESLPTGSCEFTFTAVTGGYSIQKPNDDYLGYTSTSDNNQLAFGNYSSLIWSVNANAKDGSPANGVSLTTSEYKVSANASAGSDTWVRGYKSSGSIYQPIYLFKKATAASTATNYSTTCAAAPAAEANATDVAALVNVAAAGASGTITMTYEHVNASGVAVSLWNNAACTEAFEDSWLTASLDGDKNITYTIEENTSYNDARSAYIRLIAPETSGAASPADVRIPVSQVKKAAVFASLEELAAADVNANTEVTVSFSDVVIKEIYMYHSDRRGLVFNIQKDGEDVKIYFNADVPAAWVAGGKVSGTLTNCPWKIYSDAWQLAPASGWAWDQLTYTAPPAIESIEIRGNATQKTYIDGQVFDPAGLSVFAIYDNSYEEDVTRYASWSYNPAKLSKDDTEVTVTATYNEKSDDETVTGLTVNPIPDKTIAEFIAAGGTRCYLEGTVGTIDNTKYGNFKLTDDASGTIYVYGCLTPEGESAKFNTLGVSEGDKIKVIAEQYLNHETAGDEAVNVVFVSKISPVQITIADKNLEVGHSWTIEATTNPAAAVDHISYSIKNDGSDAYVSLEGNVITANDEGTATIIASIPDGDGYLANSIEFNVHVTPAIVRTGIYAKVTSNEELKDGEYLIVYEDGSLAFNGGLETLDASSNNFAVTIESNKIIATAEIDAKSFTITNGTIKSASGKFIGKTANSNGMNESSEEQYTNTLSIDNEGNAVIVGSAGAYMRYNATSGQERFRYFKSDSYTNQKAIQLYRKMDYTRAVSGNYGTICLPKAGVMTNGALYEISYYDADQKKIFFDEIVNGEMEAGIPYIFQPAAGVEKINVYYSDNTAEDVVAGNRNGLIGFYNLNDPEATQYITQDAGYYILYNNQYWLVSGRAAYVENYRAYIRLADITPSEPTLAPGRRRISMSVNDTQTTTGVENGELINGENGVQKVLIDGELFILRGEKMYDAKGQLVK